MTCLLVDVNLRDLYPSLYEKDTIIQLKVELIDVFNDYYRAEHTYKEQIRRNKAYYYLDQYEWLEKYAINKVPTPAEILCAKETELKMENAKLQLEEAISNLSDIQKRRVHRRNRFPPTR